MKPPERLLEVHATLTPDDHQTHRRYFFQVPPDARQLEIGVRYEPKRLGQLQSAALAEAALARQTASLSARVERQLAAQWSADHRPAVDNVRVVNLLTISLDDAAGAYRGAGHRHANDQHFVLGPDVASPGLVGGPLPPGQWTLTLSAHTVASDQCEFSIQIEAEIASSP